MVSVVEQHQDEVAELCRRYGVRRLELFGSAATGHFDPKTSDLDFLVEFDNFTIENAADRYLGLLVDLEDLFGRRVDLVSTTAIRNPYFRQVVERDRILLYAA